MTPRRMLLLAVPVVVALLDFTLRVHVGRDDAEREFRIPPIPDSTPSRTLKSVRADLAAWFPQLGIPAGDGAEAVAMQATGLTLGGIFTENDARVALLLVERAGGRPDRYRVKVGDEVLGMKVAEIGQRSVTLNDGATGRTLEIFRRSRSSIQVAATGATPPATAGTGTSAAASAAPGAEAAAGSVKEVKSIELKPGEQPAFATDLPIVELDASAVKDRDPAPSPKK